MSAIDTQNQDLFLKHAKPGVVGLAGGAHFVDRTIRKVQRRWRSAAPRSLYSHAFICSGLRADGQHWVLESDLTLAHKQIRLGVQENRAAKYFSAADYPNLALLDFGLDAEKTTAVLTAALDLLAGQSTYSLRELLGTLLSLQRPSLRSKENLLAREGAVFCSAMVQHCFNNIGAEFVSGVVTKNITPEDIASTTMGHLRFAVTRAPD
jgi:hypothetical protein